MTKDEVLTQTNRQELHPKEAYKMLYPKLKERKPRRSSFVRISIKVPDSKGVSVFLGVLLLLPIPIFIIKWVLKKRANKVISDQFQLTPLELIELVSIKGVKVDIKSNTNERVLIKTI